jgi:hypothetical protein
LIRRVSALAALLISLFSSSPECPEPPCTDDVATRLNLPHYLTLPIHPCHVVLLWSCADGWTRNIVAITTVWSGIGYLISKDAVKQKSSPQNILFNIYF